MKLGSEYFVHESSFIDEDVSIGRGTKIWHFSHIQSGSIIGDNCSLGQNVNVGNNVIIGNNVKIQNNVSVYDGVIIEDNVFVGPSVVFTNVKVPKSNESVNKNYVKTILKSGCSIGANTTIICGINIGENSFVGAGSVVTKDITKNTMWYGNPAIEIKKLDK